MEPVSDFLSLDSCDPKQPPHRNLGYLLPQVAHSLLRDFAPLVRFPSVVSLAILA